MESGEINTYMDYWMDEEGFSLLLEDDKRVVEDVVYNEDRGLPRASIEFNDNMIILFPPFDPKFNYNNSK
ncbi:MAG: hypothetical protein HOC66_05700 [Flavobacteriales bacterium]|jgi:hypothetical protein|nr:hypothetical protein [Flavobacteriales bacterium]